MRKKYTGLFITFEGGDSTGKSTQAKLLHEKMAGSVLTLEPGGTEIGKQIRKLVLDGTKELSKAAEMLLFQADRAQHYKEILKPALKDGKTVICDRYIDSSLIYQGHLRGWSLPLLFRIHNACTGMLMPDITFILDRTPEDDVLNTNDTFEKQGGIFQQKVRDLYLHLGSTHPRYRVISCNGKTVVQVHEEIMAGVEQYANENSGGRPRA